MPDEPTLEEAEAEQADAVAAALAEIAENAQPVNEDLHSEA